MMFEQLKNLHDCLMDEESKVIFCSRLLYGLTHDWKYIKDMLFFFRKEDKGYYNILDVIDEPDRFKDKEIILFGTGFFASWVVKWLQYCKLEYHFFCDNDSKKWGNEFAGKRIISPEDLFKEHQAAWVLIASDIYEEEMILQLQSNQFPNEQIIRLVDFIKKKEMYLAEGILYPQKDEVYIDGGSYDGSSSLEFIKWAGKENVKKVYAFEPEPNNYKICQNNMKENCKTDYEVLQLAYGVKKQVYFLKMN